MSKRAKICHAIITKNISMREHNNVENLNKGSTPEKIARFVHKATILEYVNNFE